MVRFEREFGRRPLRIWYPPEPERLYVLGVDTAEGSGTRNADSSAIQVLDVESCVQCAEFRSTSLSPDEFAEKVALLGRYYRGRAEEAYCVVEVGPHGDIVALDLHRNFGYRALYADRRQITRLDSTWNYRKLVLGWKSTAQSRHDLVDRARQRFREITTPEYIAKFGAPIQSFELMEQIQAFHYEEKEDGSPGKPKAEKKGHDDLVMAWCLANLGTRFAGSGSRARELEVDEPKPDRANTIDGDRLKDRAMRRMGRPNWRRELARHEEILKSINYR